MAGSIYSTVFGGSLVAPAIPTYLALSISANAVLGWPLESNITSPAAAEIIDVTATAAGLTVQLSDARQVGTGYCALFNNVGGNTFTVLDAQGNTLMAVASGQAWQIYLADNSTLQGTWRVFQYGAGVSNANAATLAGNGLKAISTTLNERIVINQQNTNYAILNSDRAACVEWIGGSGGVFTAPSAAVVGSDWFCYVKNSGTGALTLSGTIDGTANKNFNPNDSCILASDGTNLFTIGFGQAVASTFSFVTISLNPPGTGTVILSGVQLNRVSYKFTGALTGNVLVQVPGAIQQYWVDNETTGAFTVSLGTGSGTTATVAQGQRNILYCDGLNVVTAVTFGSTGFGNGSAGAPSIFFAASPATGLYSPAANQLAISTNGVQRVSVDAAGHVTILSPDTLAAPALTVTGAAATGTNPAFLVTTPLTQSAASPGIAIETTSASGFSIFALMSGTSGNVLGTNDFAILQNGTTNDTTLLNRSNANLILGTNGTNRVTIGNAGNVTVAAPTTGVNLVVPGIGGTAAITAALINLGSSQAFIAGAVISTSSALAIGTTAAAATQLWANNIAGLTVTTTGGVQVPAVATTASAANCFLDSANANNILRSTSSSRYKKDIEDLPSEVSSRVLELRPIRYRSKAAADDATAWWYGLIAEEVAKVEPRLVHYAPDEVSGESIPDGVQYERVSVLLLAEVQKLSREVAQLRAAH